MCQTGWTGAVCNIPCAQLGKWGPDCRSECDCFNGGTCDSISGQCVCPPGYTGDKCQNECFKGQYGLNCSKKCECFNDAPCDLATGVCNCPKGYSGVKCEIRNCAYGKYGLNCENICQCSNVTTAACDPFDGTCKCKPVSTSFELVNHNHVLFRIQGFTSKSLCHKQCPQPYYGDNCKQICSCKNGLCHHITGECICYSGWSGPNCEKPCSSGTYGVGCSQKCLCFANLKCNPENGQVTSFIWQELH